MNPEKWKQFNQKWTLKSESVMIKYKSSKSESVLIKSEEESELIQTKSFGNFSSSCICGIAPWTSCGPWWDNWANLWVGWRSFKIILCFKMWCDLIRCFCIFCIWEYGFVLLMKYLVFVVWVRMKFPSCFQNVVGWGVGDSGTRGFQPNLRAIRL